LADLDGHEAPLKDGPAEQRVDEGGPRSHVEHSADGAWHVDVQPEEVVDPGGDSGAQVGRRASPVHSKDVLHDCLRQPDKALLAGKVPHDPAVQDDHVFSESRL
jgi:hypothetical protein